MGSTSLNPASPGPPQLLQLASWLLQMLLDPSKSVIKPCLFYKLLHLVDSGWRSTNKRHISFTLQLLPITERPQETKCGSCGNWPHERLAATQRVSLSHPKAPVSTSLGYKGLLKTESPGELFPGSLSLAPLGCFLNPCGQEAF